jgi:4-amino-4-deoxy-L-arabinose transferase-like glycosyltransferase
MAQVQAGPRLSFAVLAASAVLLLTGLGWLDADAPDEPRALQIAEEMRSFEHGPAGLVLLHLNGEVYTQKPPLYYWLAAAAGAPAGRVSEFAARLPSALAGLFVVWLTLHLGTRMLGSGTGVLGAAILVTVYSFSHLARRVQFDVLLTAFELSALACFWWLDRGLGRPRLHQAGLHLALGLGVLTKGPVGFLIPVLTIAAFLVWERRPRDLARAFPLWGFVLSLGPGLLWIAVATALAPAGFASTAVGENVFGRFFAGTSHARPFHYYLWSFPQEFLPWTLAWPALLLSGRRQVFAPGADGSAHRAWRFLLAGIAVSLVFFSLSSGKRGLYQLPIFPATALLTADALLVWLAGRARLPRAFTIGAASVIVLLLALGAEAIAAGLGRPFLLPAEQVAELRAPLLLAFGCGLIGVAFAALAAWLLGVRNRVSVLAFPGLVAGTLAAVELAVFLLLYPALEPTTTLRPTALAAAERTLPDGRIGLLGSRSMVGGLAYYGDRRVAELRTPEDVERFFAAGGGALVLKKKKLERLDMPLAIVHRARSGRRELVVVTPATDGSPGAPRLE